MHVVIEVATGTCVVEIGEVVLALMAKRRVPEVMTDGDGLYEVEVEAKRHADGAPHATDHLQMKGTTRDVVVAHEREDLRLVRTTRVERIVDDLLDVDARAPEVDVRVLVALRELAYALVITAGIGR